jgi:hypothetical protein
MDKTDGNGHGVFLIEVRDDDGNDATVYDALITAPSYEAAVTRLWTHLFEQYPADQSDGGDGTFHPCTCHCPHRTDEGICDRCQETWECSHGGLIVSDAFWQYPTVDAAHQGRKRYHALIDLTDPA